MRRYVAEALGRTVVAIYLPPHELIDIFRQKCGCLHYPQSPQVDLQGGPVPLYMVGADTCYWITKESAVVDRLVPVWRSAPQSCQVVVASPAIRPDY